MTTIVLLEDHKIVRQGLKMLLNAEADFEVIGEAADGLEGMDMVRKLQPDVLVTDMSIPGLNGIEVVRTVKAEYPNIKTIVLSMHASEDFVLPAFAEGALGYVLKDSCADDLVNAIHQAFNGCRYLSPKLAER